MKPIIGIALDFLEGNGPSFPGSLARLVVAAAHKAAFDAVAAAGGIPVGLGKPMDAHQARAMCQALDGLLLAGGAADVFPGLYGQPLTEHNKIISIPKDESDLAWLRAMLEAGKPVLGLGRGMQLMNAAMGGTLLPDIAACVGEGIDHDCRVAPGWLPVHPVAVDKGSRLGGALPAGLYEVNSRHHQSVEVVAPGLAVCAHSPDGVAEALEGEALPLMGVQWHPEFMFSRHPEQLVPFSLLVEWAEKQAAQSTVRPTNPLVGVALDYYNEDELIWPAGSGEPLLGDVQLMFDALGAAGCLPVGLPAPLDDAAADEVMARLGGLLVPGSASDVFPGRYGQAVTRYQGRISMEKDELDLAWLKSAFAAGKPVMGVCRGMQIINVFMGGTLVQDVPAFVGNTTPHNGAAVPVWQAIHPVRLWPGAALARHMPAVMCGVNSYHHQAAASLANGLRLAATSADGIIEAFEGESAPVLGVQWHPEFMFQEAPEQLGPFRRFAEMLAE